MLRIECRVIIGIRSDGDLLLDGKRDQTLGVETATQAAKQTPHEIELLSKVLEGAV
jgi:hypothetical protein